MRGAYQLDVSDGGFEILQGESPAPVATLQGRRVRLSDGRVWRIKRGHIRDGSQVVAKIERRMAKGEQPTEVDDWWKPRGWVITSPQQRFEYWTGSIRRSEFGRHRAGVLMSDGSPTPVGHLRFSYVRIRSDRDPDEARSVVAHEKGASGGTIELKTQVDQSVILLALHLMVRREGYRSHRSGTWDIRSEGGGGG